MTEPSPPQAEAAAAATPVSPPVTNIRARAAAATAGDLAWSGVVGKLAGDPSLRYTDGGRAFLRWMTQHAMHLDEWREFVDAIPERWLEEVRQAAATMSEEWGQFASQLGCRQDQAEAS